MGISWSSLWELKRKKILEIGKHCIYVADKTRNNILFNVNKIRGWQIDITKYIEIPERDINTATKIRTFEDCP